MTAPIAPNEPAELRAGLNWDWRRDDLTDYPSGTYVLTYWFKKKGATGANFSIVAATSGAGYLVGVAAATTAAYVAGDYSWVAVVTAGSNAYEVDDGNLTLLPKYNSVADLDDRSHARRVLDAIEAAIEGRASKVQLEYSILNRAIKFWAPADLIKFRQQYKSEVAAEEAAANVASGGVNSRRTYVRFGRA